MILGITGQKFHGKNTVAALVAKSIGVRVREVAFAAPIKEFARDYCGLSAAQTDGDLKEVVDERWGLTPRQIMQRYGTEVGRQIHPDIWIRACLGRIANANEPDTLWIVTDLRFHNEAAALRAAGAKLWRVERRRVDRPELAASGDLHASELEIASIEVDRVIRNTGTLADLEQAVYEAMVDL